MGAFDIYCCICGLSYHINDTPKIVEKQKWLKKALLITASGAVIIPLIINGVDFETRDMIYEAIVAGIPLTGINYGYFIHADCGKFFAKLTGQRFCFNMLNPAKIGHAIEFGGN